MSARYWIILLFSAVVLIIFIALGSLLIVSGGNPIDWVRGTILQASLDSRRAELEASVGTDDTPLRFTIELGDSPQAIAERLFEQSLILDSQLFVDYARAKGLDRQLEAGTYFLNQTQTIPEIAEQLTDSANSHILFSIIEGWRMEEIASSIDALGLFAFSGNDFLNAVSSSAVIDPAIIETLALPAGNSLEGFLFPDTYVLPPDISATELRDLLITTFIEKTNALQIDASNQGWSLFDVVTLASIIEREGVHSEENPTIASVYRNRLDSGLPLQADPTVQYGLNGTRGDWWANITVDDYQSVQSPYNTYLHNGLPPGPIASPGLSAIQAVVYPADTDFVYFRARCDGSGFHEFTRTFEEHLANACP